MKRILLSLFLAAMILMTPAVVHAYDPISTVCGAVGASTALCGCDNSGPAGNACNRPSQNPLTGPNGLIHTVTNIIAAVAGIVAVITIIVAGVRYITSGGDPQQVKGAQSALVAALIGIAIIALADVIITFVVSKV